MKPVTCTDEPSQRILPRHLAKSALHLHQLMLIYARHHSRRQQWLIGYSPVASELKLIRVLLIT